MPGILSKSRTGMQSIKRLLLLCLAFAHIAIAGHQIEHETHEHDERCAIFAQVDRDAALLSEVFVNVTHQPGESDLTETECRAPQLTCVPFHSRAPRLPNSSFAKAPCAFFSRAEFLLWLTVIWRQEMRHAFLVLARWPVH